MCDVINALGGLRGGLSRGLGSGKRREGDLWLGHDLTNNARGFGLNGHLGHVVDIGRLAFRGSGFRACSSGALFLARIGLVDGLDHVEVFIIVRRDFGPLLLEPFYRFTDLRGGHHEFFESVWKWPSFFGRHLV